MEAVDTQYFTFAETPEITVGRVSINESGGCEQ